MTQAYPERYESDCLLHLPDGFQVCRYGIRQRTFLCPGFVLAGHQLDPNEAITVGCGHLTGDYFNEQHIQ